MRKVSLKVRLTGAFVAVASITLLVGFSGWYGVSRLNAYIEDMSEVQAPSILSMSKLESASQEIITIERSLLNPNLDPESRRRLYEDVGRIREEYRKAWNS